ncbi:MAG: GHMP kinase [Anaerolineae bacterium]|nr:GHMP kinase [Anaerolineae bacterium]
MQEPLYRSRAPIRVDLAGGWTDVPFFAAERGGAVVNATINRYTYATLTPRPDEKIEITSADFHQFLSVRNFRELEYDGNLDLIKAAISRLGIQRGMNLFVRCDAPPGSGTGSSASIGVALIGLLNLLQDNRLSCYEVARLANLLETEELHIAGGKQDQYAAAIGGFNFMEFEETAVNVSPLHLDPSVVTELEKHLVLCYTGKSRLSGNLITTVQEAYRAGRSQTVNALLRIRDVAVEMKSALLKGQIGHFGRLLQENWENQKLLDPSISTAQIDSLFDAALDAGAVGGKALGAGGGGCVLFLSNPDRERDVRTALEQAGVQIIEFNFEFGGLRTWSSLNGARVVA